MGYCTYLVTSLATASRVYVTVNGSELLLWNTNPLPANSNDPELRPVPLISIGISTMSFNVVTAILLLPAMKLYGSPCSSSIGCCGLYHVLSLLQ
jgi:hypothetical protein